MRLVDFGGGDDEYFKPRLPRLPRPGIQECGLSLKREGKGS